MAESTIIIQEGVKLDDQVEFFCCIFIMNFF